MQSLDSILVSYGRYHRTEANRRTHFIGVPLVLLGALLLLNMLLSDWIPVLSPAAWVVILLWTGYLVLSPRLALVLLLPMLGLGLVANILSAVRLGAFFFVVTSGIGWYYQLKGHRAEGNRPALRDNLLQTLAAPLFLAAEYLFKRGWNPELARRVHGV